MLEDSELETNVLEFSEKSFSFARAFDFDGSELLLFHRTETESESRFRPRLIRLYLVLPRSWIVSDLASERLSIRPPGASGPRPAGRTAQEAAAQPSRFDEQGASWQRAPLGDRGFLYAPIEWAERLLSPSAQSRIPIPE